MNYYYNVTRPRDNFILIQFNGVVPTDREFEEYKEELETILDENDYFLVVDITQAAYLDASQRIDIGRILANKRRHMRRHCHGVIYVSKERDLIPRMNNEGIFLISPPGVPYAYADTLDQALSIGKEMMSGSNKKNTFFQRLKFFFGLR